MKVMQQNDTYGAILNMWRNNKHMERIEPWATRTEHENVLPTEQHPQWK
jgi:hypothetical protein